MRRSMLRRSVLRRLLPWVAFGVGVYSLSMLWGAVRGAWIGHPTLPPLAFGGVVLLFLSSLGYMGFVVYAGERSAGRVRRRIALFDRILDARPGSPDPRPGPSGPRSGSPDRGAHG